MSKVTAATPLLRVGPAYTIPPPHSTLQVTGWSGRDGGVRWGRCRLVLVRHQVGTLVSSKGGDGGRRRGQGEVTCDPGLPPLQAADQHLRWRLQ